MKLEKIILFYILINCLNSKINSKKINCVADYLLIERNLQAKIFIEKIGEEVKVIRGIPKKLVKDFKIEENEMREFYEENNSCLEENKEFVIEDKRTFKKVLIVKYLTKNIKKKYLILSNDYQDFGKDIKYFYEKLALWDQNLILSIYRKNLIPLK